MEKKYVKQLQSIIDRVLEYNPGADVEFLTKAFNFAYEAHKNQLRRSGEPYFVHCISVGEILIDLKLDYVTISAGFLHDVIEDTNIHLEEISEKFSPEVANLVNGLTKISDLRLESPADQQAGNFRKMLLSMTEDLRVILIRFADRLHNMMTIEHMPEKSQVRIAQETLEVYAPLAHRFGIAKLKSQLEDLSLKVIDKEAYREIEKKVKTKRLDRENYLQLVIEPIEKELERHHLKARVFGRVKHFYSIYTKMKKRGKTFEEILDLIAIRIIAERIEDCYFVLGIVHSIYVPVPERFSDFIAVPKPNMYQSLHTKVIGPEGKMVEIQIRTEIMDQTAESGIAAHWRYKEGKAPADEIDAHARWLRQLLDWQQEATTSEEFMEDLKINLFHDEIFVFTPMGKLITLPKRSTPIDFAFAVHSELGLHTIGAKVNGKIVPLPNELVSGDSVEIITSANQRPSFDWLKYVKTSKAKSRIKKFFRESQFEQSTKLGHEMIDREMSKLKLKKDAKTLNDVFQSFGFSSVEELYAAVGSGDIAVQNVIRKLMPVDTATPSTQSMFERLKHRLRKDVKGVRVQGIDNLMINFAKCCRPLPGDKITGFITTGKGITIHRTDCRNIEQLLGDPDRNVPVEWDAERDTHFNARIRVLSEDRKRLLRDITDAVAAQNVNIVGLDMKLSDSMAVGDFLLEVHNLAHLVKVIRQLRNVKGVVSVKRLDHTGDVDLLVEKGPMDSFQADDETVDNDE